MRLKATKRNAYRAYADVYDDFKGDRTATVQLVRDIIQKYRPGAQAVLDLACGTGAISKGLADSFTIAGLDISPHMLKIAERAVPEGQFTEGDMADFNLGRQFDVIFCLHNSVNHLLEPKQLESMFGCVAQHLTPGGIFIFDMNPPSRMERLAALEPYVQSVGKNYVITQVAKAPEPNSYIWDVQLLLKQKGKYTVHHEPVTIATHTEDEIAAALHGALHIVDSFELPNPTTPDDIGRVYYVCRR